MQNFSNKSKIKTLEVNEDYLIPEDEREILDEHLSKPESERYKGISFEEACKRAKESALRRYRSKHGKDANNREEDSFIKQG